MSSNEAGKQESQAKKSSNLERSQAQKSSKVDQAEQIEDSEKMRILLLLLDLLSTVHSIVRPCLQSKFDCSAVDWHYGFGAPRLGAIVIMPLTRWRAELHTRYTRIGRRDMGHVQRHNGSGRREKSTREARISSKAVKQGSQARQREVEKDER